MSIMLCVACVLLDQNNVQKQQHGQRNVHLQRLLPMG